MDRACHIHGVAKAQLAVAGDEPSAKLPSDVPAMMCLRPMLRAEEMLTF